jgi:hypothetical protein
MATRLVTDRSVKTPSPLSGNESVLRAPLVAVGANGRIAGAQRTTWRTVAVPAVTVQLVPEADFVEAVGGSRYCSMAVAIPSPITI